MSKEQIVSDAKAALLAGQDALLSQVLSDVADKSAAEVPVGGFSQADLDAAKQAQKDADSAALDELAQKEAIEAEQLAKIKAVLGLA